MTVKRLQEVSEDLPNDLMMFPATVVITFDDGAKVPIGWPPEDHHNRSVEQYVADLDKLCIQTPRRPRPVSTEFLPIKCYAF